MKLLNGEPPTANSAKINRRSIIGSKFEIVYRPNNPLWSRPKKTPVFFLDLGPPPQETTKQRFSLPSLSNRARNRKRDNPLKWRLFLPPRPRSLISHLLKRNWRRPNP